ncbi:MAG: Gfo/Idh/MocA family oxidoreductase [Bacteroidota bacterium]
MKETINWGIIGLGKIARQFANDLKYVPHAQLHAVASRSAAKAKDFAAAFGATHSFGSYEEMMRCDDLDVVYVATPHVKHCENTIMCLENGIAVLCEKPFAMDSGEVQRMIAAAKANDTFLMEAIWTRFLPHIKKVIEHIQSGIIGEVKLLRADFGFKAPIDFAGRLYNKSLGGGSLLDVGIYPLFLAQLLMGNPIDLRASAHIGQTEVDESCAMILRYAEDKMAVLDSSIVRDTPMQAGIYGTRGKIQIQSRWHESNTFTIVELDKAPQTFTFDYEGAKGYRYETQHVVECLQRGKKESDLLPLSFSLDLMNLLDEVRAKIGLVY